MRLARTLLALSLLAVPVGARGEDIAQPVPANGQCSVPADPQWTPQEKFVWRQVCAGKEANFNVGTDYGGNLDSKRKEALPENRILRPAFLETILLADKYRRALTRVGVRIIGARFTEKLDLNNAELRHEFWLADSLFEKGANFRRLRSTQLVALGASKITGTLDMERARVGDLFLSDGAELSDIDLKGAHLDGVLSLIGSKVTGTLDMDKLKADSGLYLSDRAEFKEIVLRSAHVGGVVSLIDSNVVGTLDMEGLEAGSTVFLSGGAEFDGLIDLVFSKIRGNLELADGTFKGAVELTGAQIGGELRLGSSRHRPAHWPKGSRLILRNAKADAIQDVSDSWPDE